MAPDLNAVANGDKFDYLQPGSSGYDVKQDITWKYEAHARSISTKNSRLTHSTSSDPKNRKLRVLSIGGGVTGILMAYQIQKHCENVEHVIYEKNEDIGGTWLENR